MKKTKISLIRNCMFAGLLCLPLAAGATIQTCTESSASQYELRTDNKTEVVKYLLVWDKAGGSIAFPLEERPRIVTDVEQQVIKCITSKQEVSFSMKDVHKYTLDANGENIAGVEDAFSEEESFRRDANNLGFENFKAGSAVYVYTINGVVTDVYKVNDDGRLTISMEGWCPGVYLIKTESVTYKVVKK